MGHFAPGDLKASWVAIFILFILWWLTVIPKFFQSYFSKEPSSAGKEGDGSASAADDTAPPSKLSRAHKAYNRARDGVLWLLTAVTISFAGQGNEAATNALA